MPSRAANTTSSNQPRYRCPVCGQYPTLTKEGALRNHSYPWYHSQSGSHCSGSGSQIMPLPGQTSLPECTPEELEHYEDAAPNWYAGESDQPEESQ